MIKWTAKEKEKIILEFNKSNSKIKDFAANANISITTLNNWIKQYNFAGIDNLLSKRKRNILNSGNEIKNNQKEINLLKK